MSPKLNTKEIPMVRILPMDSENEFDGNDIETTQTDFFLEDLPFRKDRIGQGKYRYKETGMKAEPGTVVLFQYDGKIIASAVLENIDNKPQPEPVYFGAYYFTPSSIQVFEPVGSEEMISIWSDDFVDSQGVKHKCFKRFGQAKIYLDPEKYADFCSILRNVRTPQIK